MATAFDHMTPFFRLNYWLRQRISELKEEVRLLTAEKRMWLEPEIANAIVVPSIYLTEVETQILALDLERSRWEGLLDQLDTCEYCNGYGRIREIIAQDESISHECLKCNGTGKRLQTQGV
jgi:hypothetical protein